MYKRILILLTTIIAGFHGMTQHHMMEKDHVMGMVLESDGEDNFTPLPGVNVVWIGTSKGTSTDTTGMFHLNRAPGIKQLVFSYVGYASDTINIDNVENPKRIMVVLRDINKLEGVTVTSWQPTSFGDPLDPMGVMNMSQEELFKAACCNLSESFETNPSVDVSFADAVTGTRQIEMLGLAGKYSQILSESVPFIRGLNSSTGLTYIPGTWINSIQVAQGTGSVVNGFESISGQINVELKKPQESERFFLNTYGNMAGRMELNLNSTHYLTEKLATTFLVHGSTRQTENDRNSDGFLDFPVGRQLNFVNRWRFDSHTGIIGQAGLRILDDDRQGGEVAFDPETDRGSNSIYGLEINNQRIEGWMKVGYIWEEKGYQSIGLQLNGYQQEMDSYFGLNDYDAVHNSFYANLIYQSIIGNTNHSFRTGVSFLLDEMDEVVNTTGYYRLERVPGIYGEYTWTVPDWFTLVAGLRADFHNIYGTFITPRLHARFGISDNTTLRTVFGRGTRTANVFAENLSLFASSRNFTLSGNEQGKPYGFRQEKAWNTGFNLSHDFYLFNRSGSIRMDYHYTWFDEQVVVDLYDSPGIVDFHNLDGDSYSQSLQVQIDYELVKRLKTRVAYRWLEVQTDYNSGLRRKPLTARNRAFINLEYSPADSWSIDYTLQWIGAQPFPTTDGNPEIYELDRYSPDYFLMNAQITKTVDKWAFYVGGENLAGFQQEDPILAVDQPFSPYFDTTYIYGPIFGRMIYAGLRFAIK